MKTQKFMSYWPKVRQKGRARYILTRGMLLSGGLYLLATTLYTFLLVMHVDPEANDPMLVAYAIMEQMVVNFVLALAFGLFMGYFLWTFKQRRYKLNKAKYPDGRIHNPWHPDFKPLADDPAEPTPQPRRQK